MAQEYSLASSSAEKASPVLGSQSRLPLKFFALVFVLSVPFWLIGAATSLKLLPGLPIAALGAFCPVIAAVVLIYRQNGRVGVMSLLKRSFDFTRSTAPIWYLPALLIMPVVSVLSFVMMRLTGTPVPDPEIALGSTLILCIVFFVGALGEELGWAGYVTDPLQDRWGALRGSLILGVIWAVWHYVPLLQADRSVEWIAWWSLGTLSSRVVMVWLYNKTGKNVFAAALFHMMINVTWQLFPINGSYFDPRIASTILALMVVVIIGWDRHRSA